MLDWRSRWWWASRYFLRVCIHFSVCVCVCLCQCIHATTQHTTFDMGRHTNTNMRRCAVLLVLCWCCCCSGGGGGRRCRCRVLSVVSLCHLLGCTAAAAPASRAAVVFALERVCLYVSQFDSSSPTATAARSPIQLLFRVLCVCCGFLMMCAYPIRKRPRAQFTTRDTSQMTRDVSAL